MSEYQKSFSDHLLKLAELTQGKQELEDQIDKLKTLVVAEFELMDEKEKAAYSEAIEQINRSDQSLTHEIRHALTRAGSHYLTPIQIRSQLESSGYDFSEYKSNPLVSIHSTLNRMKHELEVATLEEGTKGYRFRRNAPRSRSFR